MQKIFVIDASGYLYRSYFAIRNITNAKGESTNALFGYIRSVLKLFKDFHPDYLVAVFDGPRNAKKRVEIYPEYKAHRTAMPPDLLYQIQWAQEFCSFMGIPYLNIPEVEADDTMGTVALWAEKEGAEVFLCTSDKDMCQMVNEKVHLLNTHKENLLLGPKEVEEIHGVPPKLIIDLLAMIGDASDNVPGVPGLGPKTAASLLKQFGSLEYILEHPEEIAGAKKQETIVQNRDKALISKKLVTLDLSVHIPLETNFYQLKKPDIEKLKKFYSSMNFNSLIKELESSNETPTCVEAEIFEEENYCLVDDEKSFQELLQILQGQKEICIDVEATDFLPMKAELVGVGFGFEPKKAWYVPVNGKLGLETVLKGLKPLLENPHIGFYGHNIKFDYQLLRNYGLTIQNLAFDTILASYLLNSHSRQHSLDNLSLQYFGKVKTPISDLVSKGKNLINMREAPIEKVMKYCCQSIDLTCRLKIVLENELKERNLEKLLKDIELPLSRVLADMEKHGIFLDKDILATMSKGLNALLQMLEKDIFQLAGTEFNLNSPKQLSEVLFTKLGIKAPKKTATGLSTNADVLESLSKEYPIARLLQDYRTLEKLRSTYVEILPHEVNAKTQRIHCTFNQFVAATGRLSCQDPNLQNIPVRTEAGRKIREAFRPEKKGWSYLAADYSQIELRLLAHLSDDPRLLKAFQNNEDIHVATAAAMYNIPLEQVTKEQRHNAKAVNFGIIYGQQAFGLSQELNIDVKQASAFIEKYFNLYSHVKSYLDSCKEKARKTGRAVTITGRERLIPEIHSKNAHLRALAERLAVNTPFQGTAADLIKLAMLKVDKRLHKEKKLGYMILQIHDELIFEVPDFELIDFEPLIREEMQNVFQLKVPLIVDITIGKNWKEC